MFSTTHVASEPLRTENARIETERFAASLLAASKRSDAQKLWKSFPQVRDRTSGPVGPEPDYSVRIGRFILPKNKMPFASGRTVSGNIQFEDISRLRFRYTDDGLQYASKAISLHNEFPLTLLNDKGVLEWTRYAMQHNIHFSGDRGYVIPSTNPRKKIIAFRKAKDRGEVPSGRRSPAAAARRRSDRKVRRKLARSFLPLEVKEPLELRASKTSRELRKLWRSSPQSTRWSVWRSTQVVEPVLCVALSRRPVEPSRPVLEALQKIYSNVEYQEKVATFPSARLPEQRVHNPPPQHCVADIVDDKVVYKTFNSPMFRVGRIISLGDGEQFVRYIGGCTYQGFPAPDARKYWYFRRKRGTYSLSVHHPLPGDDVYFKVDLGGEQLPPAK